MRALPAFAIDAVLIVGFAALGRRSHDEGSSLTGVLEVAAPFLIAMAVGWLVARAWRSPLAPATGVVIWIVTIVVGMALRSLVFDRGIAPTFIAVALLTLALLLVGWRLLATRLLPRRAPLEGPADEHRPHHPGPRHAGVRHLRRAASSPAAPPAATSTPPAWSPPATSTRTTPRSPPLRAESGRPPGPRGRRVDVPVPADIASHVPRPAKESDMRHPSRTLRLGGIVLVAALAWLAFTAIASAADWQLSQTDADAYYDLATLDANDNGCSEQAWFDVDNDGAWDAHLYDRGRGECFAEALSFDMNENLRPEYLMLDIDQRVGFEWLYFDTEQDGRWNFRRIIPRSSLDSVTRLNYLDVTRDQLRAFQYRTGQSVRFAAVSPVI